MALRDVYDALAAVSLTVGGKAVTVFNVDSLPESVTTADLPCRLLLPLEPREGENFVYAGIQGGLVTVTWVITDLLLVRPLAQGEGLHTVAPDLVAYAQAYLEALKPLRKLTTTAVLREISISTGVFEYPARSGNLYFGARADVMVGDEIR